MFPQISSAVAADTQHDRIARAEGVHRAHLARPTSDHRGHHLPRVGRHFRQWLANGYL